MSPEQTKHAPPLSMWRRAGDLVFISGHGSVNSRGQFGASDFEGQYRDTMQQLARTLDEIGVSFADLVSVRCYVQHASDIPMHNRLYREFLSEPFPSRTTIVNCLPPGLLFEIEAVALLSQKRERVPAGAKPFDVE